MTSFATTCMPPLPCPCSSHIECTVKVNATVPFFLRRTLFAGNQIVNDSPKRLRVSCTSTRGRLKSCIYHREVPTCHAISIFFTVTVSASTILTAAASYDVSSSCSTDTPDEHVLLARILVIFTTLPVSRANSIPM